jgi:hypothetical protein
MSPGSSPARPDDNARERVRLGVNALAAALSAHLQAVEASTGEDDPAVVGAYRELRAATEAYEELLYDAYAEVVPFSVEEWVEEDDEEYDDEYEDEPPHDPTAM